jgi:hypothetical protein
MKVQLTTPYRVTHSQHYEVTLRGNLTGLRYARTLQVFVQLVTPYRVTHLQCYEVTLHGNVTSVYPLIGVPTCPLKSPHTDLTKCKTMEPLNKSLRPSGMCKFQI